MGNAVFYSANTPAEGGLGLRPRCENSGPPPNAAKIVPAPGPTRKNAPAGVPLTTRPRRCALRRTDPVSRGDYSTASGRPQVH
jgi:hypothetical protein